ncbi:hypothetical protein CE91St41_21390 [Oscillospiraceae bacterium]|nr:hypothetical protein CE91St41_21390 [Oscillospiraceae bacterium]
MGIGPYECQALYGAWQYERLFRHLIELQLLPSLGGSLPQGRQPYYQRAKAEPSPERYQVLQAT